MIRIRTFQDEDDREDVSKVITTGSPARVVPKNHHGGIIIPMFVSRFEIKS